MHDLSPVTSSIPSRCSNTHNAAPSAPPRDLSAQTEDPNTILVTWTPPVQAHLNGVLDHYTLYYTRLSRLLSDVSEGGGDAVTPPEVTVVTVEPSAQQRRLVDLRAYSEYEMWVSASTGAGEGPPSEHVVVNTEEASMYICYCCYCCCCYCCSLKR